VTEGARVWLIPDGYLPERSQGDQPSHEAICVLNTGTNDATLRITFYFEDRPPLREVAVVVPAERTRHLRTDQPEQLGGQALPRGVPYAVRVTSDHPVVVQHSRLDSSATALALMTTLAHPVPPDQAGVPDQQQA
jgi:hypothetical protein